MSRVPSRGSGGGKRSWRHGSSARGAAPKFKRTQRLLLTLLLSGLIAAFVFLQLRGCERNAQFVLIKVQDSKELRTQSFAQQDSERLLTLDSFRNSTILSDTQADAASFGELNDKLRLLASSSDDKLIVYLTAHGFSDGGTAYLACSDFDPRTTAGRYPISKLLDDMQQNPAGLKLLVLDAVRLEADPRLGFVVNEFTRLVEEELLKRPQESNVFVLVSAAPFQTNAVSFGDRQGLLARFTREAFEGEADSSKPYGFISLNELYEYLLQHSARWFEGAPNLAQTPVLLQAGVGYVPPNELFNDDLFQLITYKDKEPPAEQPAADAPPETAPQEVPKKTATDKTATWQPPKLWTPAGSSLAVWQAASAPQQPPAAGTSAEKQPAATTAPPAEGQAGDSAPPTATPAASDATAPSSPTPAATDPSAAPPPATPPPATAPPPAEPKSPPEQALEQMEQAWKLRDALGNPEPGQVSPIVFAPHLWREIEADLVYWEQRLITSALFDKPAQSGPGSEKPPAPDPNTPPVAVDELAQLQGLTTAMQQLKTAIADRRPDTSLPGNIQSVGNRLLAAWNRYAGMSLVEEERFFREEHEIAVQFQGAVRQHQALVYRTVDFVRWHARAQQTSADQLLNEFLAALGQTQDELREVARYPTIEFSERQRLSKIASSVDQAASLRDDLDEAIKKEEDNALKDLSLPANQIAIARALSTALFDAERRLRLIRKLLDAPLPTFQDRRGRETMTPRKTLTATKTQWERLAQHVQLEQRLVQLVDAKAADDLKRQLDHVAELNSKLSSPPGPADEAELWKEYRLIGGVLRDFYAQLPAIASGDSRDHAQAEKGGVALHLIDYRDANASELREYSFPNFPVDYQPEKQIAISTGENQKIELRGRETKVVEIIVRATRRPLLDEDLKVENDERLLTVGKPQDQGKVIKQAGEYTKTVLLSVQANQEQGEVTAAEVSVSSASADVVAPPYIFEFILPRPDQVDLQVARIGRRQPLVERNNEVTLELFPKHETQYQFSLVNQSGLPKKLRVELYAVPFEPSDRVRPGRIGNSLQTEIYDAERGVIDISRLTLIGELKEFDLKPVTTAQFLPLAAPGGLPPAASAEGAAPATPPPPPPPAPNVSFGMLCVLHDLENSARKPWVKWIELQPRLPPDYVSAKVSFEPRVGSKPRVLVELQGKSDEGENRDFPDREVNVLWEVGDQFPPGSARKVDAKLLTAQDAKQMFVELPADDPVGKVREVHLTVDGCPRAFSFQIKCRRGQPATASVPGEETRPHAQEIEITKLSVPGRPDVYHLPPYLDAPPPDAKPKEGEPPVNHMRLAANEPVVIRSPVDDVRVHFHVDAPKEAFLGEERSRDALEVQLDGRKEAEVFADRFVQAHLEGFGERGVLRLRAEVQEQFIDIQPGLRDVEVELTGVLAVGPRSLANPPATSKAVPVIFDSEVPEIVKIQPAVPILKEQKATLTVSVVELSGIAKVDYGFSPDGKLELTDKTRKSAKIINSVRRGASWDVQFEALTEGMGVGKHLLVVEVTDKAGRVSELRSKELTIEEPKVVAIVGSIKGAVKRGGGSRVGNSLFTVELKGPVAQTLERLNPDGTFEFKVLPPGDYTLHTEGSDGGTNLVGDTSATIKDSKPVLKDITVKPEELKK